MTDIALDTRQERLRGRVARLARQWDEMLVPGLLVALVIFLSFGNEHFLTWANIKNVLTQMSILALVSTGMTFVIIGGGFDLSCGSVIAFTGSIGAMTMLRTNVAVGILVGVLLGGLVGYANGFMVAKVKVSPFISTLGSEVTVRGLALGVTGGTAVYNLPKLFGRIGSGTLAGVPGPALIFIGVFILGYIILRFTTFGLMVFAVGGNRDAARLSGVKDQRIILLTYVISGICSGIAGMVLGAQINSGEPTVGAFMELYAIAAVVLGGTSLRGGQGSLIKTLIGVLFIGLLQNGLNLMNVPYYWQQVAIGLVFSGAAAAGALKLRAR